MKYSAEINPKILNVILFLVFAAGIFLWIPGSVEAQEGEEGKNQQSRRENVQNKLEQTDVSLDVSEAGLRQVLRRLSEDMGVDIQLTDELSRDVDGVDVTARFDGIPAATALRVILQPRNFDYMVHSDGDVLVGNHSRILKKKRGNTGVQCSGFTCKSGG